MTDKEVTEMFMEQIDARDKIINKLLEERIENRKINKWELVSILTLAFMIFLICIKIKQFSDLLGSIICL